MNEVTHLNRESFKEKLILMNSFECARALNDKRETKPPLRLLCATEKDYLGSLHIYLMKSLFMLREDKNLFHFLVNTLENNAAGMTDEKLESFADELIFLFFADFTSNERNIIGILRHFKYLIAENFKKYSENKDCVILYNDAHMVTRLIKSYIKRTENREYLRLMFSKILDRMASMDQYLKEKQRMFRRERTEEMRKGSMKQPASVIINPRLIEEDEASTTASRSPKGSLIEDPGASSKEDAKERKDLPLTASDIIFICDEMLGQATKMLEFMPLAMRYLFKLIEILAEKNVKYLIIKK